ncbi:hypothetical protein Aph01nite_59210 [Acrocarpospora phusangensis]|uniref:Uncharacterized protein n=1 Tax=Acrocarpospora phusangensis TaxID=1070424 RepID=A0A919QEY4_9ACTN|nr:hypothetical protein [Acrocarpospora phusangensis]GIH27611.1 hypothetical protein Aph01nite_59210 [Acrocarpospora phusangensis]
MIVTYTPQGGTEETWDYKQADLTSAEAELVEDATGLTIDEFEVDLMKGRVKCKRALLWLHMRKEHPNLRFSEVDFKVGDLKTEFDREEKRELRERLEKSGLSGPQLEMALKLLADDEPDEPKPVKSPKKDSGATDA